jgi:hypothetical protein
VAFRPAQAIVPVEGVWQEAMDPPSPHASAVVEVAWFGVVTVPVAGTVWVMVHPGRAGLITGSVNTWVPVMIRDRMLVVSQVASEYHRVVVTCWFAQAVSVVVRIPSAP